jgi:uncharacterized membrane protein YqjE
MNKAITSDQDRSFVAIVTEMKDELKQFIQTRVQMLKAEMHQKLPSIVSALLLVFLGILLLATAWLLLSAALVAFVAIILMPNPYAWIFGLLIVTAAWIIAGLWLLLRGVKMANPKLLIPQKTIGIFKDDKLWLEEEVGGRL